MTRFATTRATRTPHVPGVGVIALVPEPFDTPWMSRHQVLTRLSSYFDVVWINPARNWREVVAQPTRPRVAGGGDPRPDGLVVYEPEPWLPEFFRPAWLERFTDRARLAAARRALVRRGCTRVLLYIWRPQFGAALDRVRHDGSLYHVVDEYSFSDDEQPVPPVEAELLRRADRVIIHSPALMEKKASYNATSMQLPNGVDFATVSAEWPEPDDLRDVPRPRIGYCGWLKNQLDWDLVESLIDGHPDRSFVFVGGVAPHEGLPERIEALSKRPNAFFLGAKTSSQLMAYPQHFDLCIMPYRETSYTRYIYPLKLHEYLASGRPVVATPIRTLQDFEAHVRLARGASAWSDALDRALAPDELGAEAVAARRAFAARHDWHVITHQVARVLAEMAGGDAPARVDSAPVPETWKQPPP